jgi:hypothetical protein
MMPYTEQMRLLTAAQRAAASVLAPGSARIYPAELPVTDDSMYLSMTVRVVLRADVGTSTEDFARQFERFRDAVQATPQ